LLIASTISNTSFQVFTFSKISKSLFDKIKSLGKICIFSLFYFVSKNILDHHLQLHNKGQWQELKSRGGGGVGGGARNSLSYFNVRPIFSSNACHSQPSKHHLRTNF